MLVPVIEMFLKVFSHTQVELRVCQPKFYQKHFLKYCISLYDNSDMTNRH